MYPIFLLIISCLFFSILASIIKFNSNFVHPIEQAFFRNFISIFLLLPFLIKKKITMPKKENIKLLLLRGLFGGTTMILLFWSYSLIPLSQAMAISFSTPVFIYFGSIFFFKEKPKNNLTALMLMGFVLTLIIIRPDLNLKLGTIFALLAAITHAITGLLVKKLSETESIPILMFSMVLLMTPITFVPSLFFWTDPSSSNLLSILIITAIVATLGNYFWTKSISISDLTNIMPFDFTKLLFATTFGLLFFNEKIDYITISCGTGLIICNTIMAKINKGDDKVKRVLSDN